VLTAYEYRLGDLAHRSRESLQESSKIAVN
jgi:hypothetical protein